LLAADREHLLECDLSLSLERDEILYHLNAPKQKCSSDYARWRVEDVEAAISENVGWEVELYTLANSNKVEIEVTNHGGIVVSLKIPTAGGNKPTLCTPNQLLPADFACAEEESLCWA
jgi:hypothetical protein